MSFKNYEVSEATKRVYRAEAIERAYDDLISFAENQEDEAKRYLERLEEYKQAEDESYNPKDHYEWDEYQRCKFRAEVYRTVAKELLKL